MTQEDLARESGMTQNNISRLENPDYGKHTISSLKRIADALDVALVVRFVPFSQYIDWLSGTPRMDEGISPKALAVPSFEREERESLLERQTYQQQPLLTKMGMSVTIVTNTASVAGMKSFSGTQAYGIVPGLFYNHSTARTYMPGATTKEQRQIFGGNEQWTTQAPPQTVFQQSTM